ncbi:MAG: sigma-70 family RNA polymerase sigma factor [Planctomycetaceae bacterium]|nr:sigma-70 family RNA polymerase sigma factor [Planctomycetales bacterium]MCB9923088.1 sigma-70 family RNA polymerase sigma factor [Planctomycetaceae bacterium]
MPHWPETNENLILRVRDPADAPAWSVFLEIYQPVVYRMARGRGLQHADAEDLTQQVFHSVAQSINRWKPGPDLPPFRAWLSRIARNAIVNALTRSVKEQAKGGSSVGDLLSAIPNRKAETTQELAHLGQMQTLRWAANRIRHEFSEDTWDMFWKTTIEGRDVAQVAESMGRSRGAIYMSRYRVTQRLKEKVQEAPEIGSDIE